MDQLEIKLREHVDDALHSLESRVSQDFQDSRCRRLRTIRPARDALGKPALPASVKQKVAKHLALKHKSTKE